MPERPPQPGDPRRPTLDDLLDRADRTALDRLTAQDDQARREADLQARLDDSLRRVFAEPDIALASPPASSFARWRWWAAAAAVLLAALGGWRYWTISSRPDVLGPIYQSTVAAGFVPEVVCTSDEEFAAWCRQYLRQPIQITSRPTEVQYVGWNKAPVLSSSSGILLVRVAGDPVIVVMDRLEWQKVVPGAIKDPSLRVFSRRIGEVVLYEVTPRDKKAVLPTLAEAARR